MSYAKPGDPVLLSITKVSDTTPSPLPLSPKWGEGEKRRFMPSPLWGRGRRPAPGEGVAVSLYYVILSSAHSRFLKGFADAW